MESVALLSIADTLTAAYRTLMHIDPIIRISFEIDEQSDMVSKVEKHATAALAWVITFNPTRHNDINDIQWSIVDAILTIMMEEFDLLSMPEHYEALRKRFITRMTLALCDLLPREVEDYESSE